MPIVRAMQRSEVKAVAEVMARSFRSEPTTTYFFGGTPDERAPFLCEMFTFAARAREATGEVLVVKDGGVVLAATITSLAEDPSWSPELEAEWHEVARKFPEGTEDRFAVYATLKKVHRPTHDHVYLVAIGVDPEHQGRGLGRMLLDAVSSLAKGRPMCLDTMDPQNVVAYRRCGYEVTAEDVLGGHPIWFMVR